MAKKCICLILCLLLLNTLLFPVLATEETEEPAQEPVTTLYISSVEGLLTLAENCRLDSYSQNLAVVLLRDIDLSGVDFSGVPFFRGSFDGDGHTIYGLDIVSEGSVLGLFRYLSETAVVKNLTVSGSVTPAGSGNTVGGIAGENAGMIENCTFRGSVSGNDQVGGIAGTNKVTGIIDTCQTEGLINGNHFVGGIAGQNMGVIRSCINFASINITSQENSVELSDITMENVTNSESANTVTDVGGIAGSSGGVIRDCDNFANVGYRQMGYNIGGIAGSQMGYLADCQNFGDVSGRKEVGGIVGQMEPVTSIIFTIDTLQILQGQLDSMGALAGRASANLQSGGSAITGQVAALQENIQTAKDAANSLLPGGSTDLDSLQAAQSALASSFSNMQSNVQGIASTAKTTVDSLSSDLRALTGQIGAMGATLSNAPENLGGSVVDISDSDTADDTTGKVFNCTNYGDVLADLNAGGIAGAISPENDLDPEDDLDISGDTSLNFDSELRAVIRDCENTALVTVTKQNGGGITGYMVLGLVKNCLNSGTLACDSADYVGGIAGQSIGFIRGSSADCILSGSTYVGGIAGSADTVSDCRSMVQLSATEKGGAVLGYTESREEVTGNYYMTLQKDPGAIDGVSYDGCAQPLQTEEFLALEELPAIFRQIVATFRFADGTQQQVYLVPGQALSESDIPKLPPLDGYSARWEGLDSFEIAFDTVFNAVYTPYITVLQSSVLRASGAPVLLTEGSFLPGEEILLTQSAQTPALQKKQTLTECVEVSLPQSVVPVTLRFLPEADAQVDVVMIQNSAGNWKEVSFHYDGSYLVFDAEENTTAIALIETASIPWYWIAIPAGVVLILCIVLIVVHKKRKTK